MLFSLDICINKKAPPTRNVQWGLTPPAPNPHLKNITPSFFFGKPPLTFASYPSPSFLGDSLPVPQKLFFHAPSPPKKTPDFSVNSHNIKTFHQ